MDESVFDVAAGSITGKHHVRAGRNNQDASHWRRVARGVVAVVCDGCGSAPSSELGARAGARLVTRVVGEHVDAGETSPAEAVFWQRVRDDVVAALDRIAAELGGPRRETVHDCLLFTLIGLVWTDELLVLFDAGDGVRALDASVERIGPYPDNAPPYLAHALLAPHPDPLRGEGDWSRMRDPSSRGVARGGKLVAQPPLAARGAGASAAPASQHRIQWRTLDAGATRRVLLATDGLADLSDAAILDLGGGEQPFRNRDVLRRRLVLAARTPAVLTDDATLVVVRRRPEPPSQAGEV